MKSRTFKYPIANDLFNHFVNNYNYELFNSYIVITTIALHPLVNLISRKINKSYIIFLNKRNYYVSKVEIRQLRFQCFFNTSIGITSILL